MSALRLSGVFLVAALATSALPAAAATSFSASSFQHSALGDTIGSSYDILNFSGASGAIDLTSPAPVSLGALSFTVGANCTSCTATPSYTDTFSLTLDGVTETVSLDYGWSSTGAVDTLTFSPISAVLFDLGGQLYAVAFDSLAPLSSDSTTVPVDDLTATITPVPEPAPWVSLAAGLVAMFGMARRRARN